MFTAFYALFVLVTIIGTLLILTVVGIPRRRLFDPETRPWQIALSIVVASITAAAAVDLSFRPRPWGEPIFHWAFLPLGAYLWARCVYLVLKRNVV